MTRRRMVGPRSDGDFINAMGRIGGGRTSRPPTKKQVEETKARNRQREDESKKKYSIELRKKFDDRRVAKGEEAIYERNVREAAAKHDASKKVQQYGTTKGGRK